MESVNIKGRLRKIEKRLAEVASRPDEQPGHYVQLLKGRIARLIEHAEPGDPVVTKVLAHLKATLAQRDVEI